MPPLVLASLDQFPTCVKSATVRHGTKDRFFPEGQVPTVFGPNQRQRQVPITNFTSPTPSKLICDECGYSTSVKRRLIDHVNNVHLNDESGSQSEDTSLVPLVPPKTPRSKPKAETALLSPSTPNHYLKGDRENNV